MALLFLCLKIFFARIADVTLGTIKTVYTVKGKTFLAGLISFVEIFIWFLIVKEALNTEYNSLLIVISYAGGYACGTIIGTYISKTFINSLITVEVITDKATNTNINKIKEEGYGVSIINTENSLNNPENRKLLIITLNSRNLNKLKKVILNFDEKAFIVVNEAKIFHNGFVK